MTGRLLSRRGRTPRLRRLRSDAPTLRQRVIPHALSRPLLVAGLAITFSLVLAGAARAGTVRVSQCNAVDAGGLWPRGYQADLWSVTNGEASVSCGGAGGRIRIDTANHRLLNDWSTDARFAVPRSMPH